MMTMISTLNILTLDRFTESLILCFGVFLAFLGLKNIRSFICFQAEKLHIIQSLPNLLLSFSLVLDMVRIFFNFLSKFMSSFMKHTEISWTFIMICYLILLVASWMKSDRRIFEICQNL